MFLNLRTKEKEILNNLYRGLEKHGYSGRVISLEDIKNLHDVHWKKYLNGNFSPRIHRVLDSIFSVKPSRVFDGAKSVLIIAGTDSYYEIKFDWINRTRRLITQPTTELYRNKEKDIKKTLAEIFEGSEQNFVRAVLPLKLLASKYSSLRYNRNNVFFIPHRQSVLILFAFYTNLPYDREAGTLQTLLDSFSEKRTQRKPGLISEFNLHETRLLLESTPVNKLPEATREKLFKTDLYIYYNQLPNFLWTRLKVKPKDFWKIP